ncbi:MAG: hypothetical protein Q9217_006440 [Psora testacea]
MAFHPTATAVIGIAISGGVGLLLILAAIVIALLRVKHKRLLSKTDAAGERRLSKYPGGHVNITEEDVAQMPGTRAAVPRTLKAPYTSTTPYTPMASRLGAGSLRFAKEPVEAVAEERIKEELVTPGKSWPLPRRLTHSSACPLTTVRQLSSQASNEASFTTQQCVKRGASEVSPLSPPHRKSTVPKASSNQNPAFNITPSPALLPKPLFHGQQRSISHGTLSELTTKSRHASGFSGGDIASSLQQTSERPRLPRSSSLCSQDPGIVPDRPVPLLPIEGTLQRLTRVKSFHEPSSRRGSEIFSDNILILDGSRTTTQTDTNFTSPSLVPPPVPESQTKLLRLREGHGSKVDTVGDRDQRDPLGATKSLAVRSIPEFCKPQRVSCQDSLPRSDSSGISKYIGYNWSRNNSDSSFNKGGSIGRPKSRLAVPGNIERRRSKRAVSPSPLINDASFSARSDKQSERASTSILQTITGNKGSPRTDLCNDRPASFTTSKLFEWDPKFFLQAGTRASLSAGKSHKRQNRILISNNRTAAPTSPPKSETGQEQEEAYQDLQKAIGSLRQPRKGPKSFRPPSAMTFDPQLRTLTPPPLESNPRTGVLGAIPYSPTLSMCNLYGEHESPDPSPISTPSHKPRHPNRFNATFQDADSARWHLPAKPNVAFRLDGNPSGFNVFRFEAEQNIKNTNASRDSTSPSKFPLPSRHPSHSLHASLTSASPIGGPRAPPSGFSPTRRRSPTKGILKNASSSPKRGSKNLGASIMALRRMNSEANQTAAPGRLSREHKRYLSLDDDDAFILENGDGNEESGLKTPSYELKEARSSPRYEDPLRIPRNDRRWWSSNGTESDGGIGANQQRSVKGPRAMPFFDVGTMSTPIKESVADKLEEARGSIYDESGFLKE